MFFEAYFLPGPYIYFCINSSMTSCERAVPRETCSLFTKTLVELLMLYFIAELFLYFFGHTYGRMTRPSDRVSTVK